ncbi:SPFH domain band 7 family protein [Acinetobacter phage Herod]|nr:SPFH domain band 7 family protein [Acinetobacter phage Herod]
MLKKIALVGIMVASAISFTGCTRVTDAEVGVKTSFTGKISDTPQYQGLYFPWVYSLDKFSTRNLIIDVSGQPIVENVQMDGMTIRVNYSIKPELAPEMWKTQKAQHMVRGGGEGDEKREIFLMGLYVETISRNVMMDVVKNYKALEVNSKRTEIEPILKSQIVKTINANGRGKYVNINEVVIINSQPPKSVMDSAKRYLTSLNDLRTKQNEVEIAKQESERLKALASQANETTLDYMRAQAQLNNSEAMMEMARNKSANKLIIAPMNITSLGKLD